MKPTQLDIIKQFCGDGDWHCQTQFWANFIRSPHKRREEIELEGVYMFQDRKCTHGHRGCKDYRMVRELIRPSPTPPPSVLPQYRREVVGASQLSLSLS